MDVVLLEHAFRTDPQFEFYYAYDAEFGLRLVRTVHPDLVILDIGLPGRDGFSVLKFIRTQEATRNLPVLGLSADALPATIKRAVAAGFDRYLTKPVNLRLLLDTVHELLRLRSAQSDAAG